MGNGIMAQMEPGHTTYYSQFSIDDFVDSLQVIYENGNVPISERKLVVITGQRGMIQVSKAINTTSNGFVRTGINGLTMEASATDLGLISKTNSEVNKYALQYAEGQYTKYIGPNGIEIEFVLDASLDDPVRNKLVGINGKGKLSSYAYYVFDMGSQNEPNIYRCKLTNSQYSDYMRYMLGMRNPSTHSDANEEEVALAA